MERNGRFTFGWCISYRPFHNPPRKEFELKTECVFCHFDRYGKKRVLQDFYILILVRKHYACGK